MNRKEWNRIKAIKPHPGVVACRGRTHDIGRNKAKREARAKGLRHIGKAARVKS